MNLFAFWVLTQFKKFFLINTDMKKLTQIRAAKTKRIYEKKITWLRDEDLVWEWTKSKAGTYWRQTRFSISKYPDVICDIPEGRLVREYPQFKASHD